MSYEHARDADDHPGPGATAAWTLVQAGALLRRADELLLQGLRTLGPDAHAGLPEDVAIDLAAREVCTLRTTLGELADAADQLRVLGDCLPDAPIEVRYEDLRTGAAEDLATGIAEPGRALLAARVLDVGEGWAALAYALRSTDAHADWHEIAPAQLLRRFRGADEQLVGRALREAGLAGEASFAECTPAQLDALARVLEAYASRPR